MDIPGPSTYIKKEKQQYFVNKVHLKNAIKICEKMLAENNYIPEECVKNLSWEKETVMGYEIYNRIVDMFNNMQLVEEEELLFSHEENIDDNFVECPSICLSTEEPSSSRSSPVSDEWINSPEKKKFKPITLDYKRKVITMANEHPKWSLQTLQKKGAHCLKYKWDLKKWEKDVLSGGTRYDKLAAINSWTMDRFEEAREKFEQVTTRMLQQWAMAAAQQFLSSSFKFTAGKTWADDFKRRNKIRTRRITKYVTEKDVGKIDEVLTAANRFRKQLQPFLQNFHPDLIINTDQTDCEYQSTMDRKLAQKGMLPVLINRNKGLHQSSHSYSVQYALTYSGKLVPKVFLCLQETGNKFEPIIQTQVDILVAEFRNVIVKCSLSGKITTNIYKEFLKEVLQPYVKNKNFLLIIDSWDGQTNIQMYDEIFVDVEDIPSCQIKIIPPKCTALCQPCDIYFYRQVKNFIKKLQNCTYLFESNREITTREDAIKIHSLVHNQLSAPIFCNMLKYAWFASQITNERSIFKNVNEVCFPDSINETKCKDCVHEMSLLLCAWCNEPLCFTCFYDKYHPKSCKLFVEQSL